MKGDKKEEKEWEGRRIGRGGEGGRGNRQIAAVKSACDRKILNPCATYLKLINYTSIFKKNVKPKIYILWSFYRKKTVGPFPEDKFITARKEWLNSSKQTW